MRRNVKGYVLFGAVFVALAVPALLLASSDPSGYVQIVADGKALMPVVIAQGASAGPSK